jgi:hypothetical protein
MKKILCALILASSLCGCSTFWRAAIATHDAIDDALVKTNSPAGTQDHAPVTSGDEQTLWPAYDAPDYTRHGYEGENAYREAAHKAARAAGLDCIRIKLDTVPNLELSMHLFHYQHPTRKGYHLADSWYFKARKAGITRWQVDIRRCNDKTAARDRFKDYPSNTVQWIE